jgi:hypothetical protein
VRCITETKWKSALKNRGVSEYILMQKEEKNKEKKQVQ